MKIKEKNEEIGNRLLIARKKLGLSQTEMGNRANIHRSFVGHVEKGTQNPSFEFLLKISQTFQISLDWLLLGLGQMMVIPEDHFLNHLKEDQIKFLEKFLGLSEDKQAHLLKAFTDIIESPS